MAEVVLKVCKTKIFLCKFKIIRRLFHELPDVSHFLGGVWLVYCYVLHIERQAFGYTVRISIFGTSRIKGLWDIIFWLLERVVPFQLICHFVT
jgi:hypothetical protein